MYIYIYTSIDILFGSQFANLFANVIMHIGGKRVSWNLQCHWCIVVRVAITINLLFLG